MGSEGPSRRAFVGVWASAVALAGGARAGLATATTSVASTVPGRASRLAGKVIEVQNPQAVVSNRNDRSQIKRMLDSGLSTLFGIPDGPSVWKSLFEPGDVVGIKVNPAGQPHVVSSIEIVWECIAGLALAGVKPRDVIVFDRFEHEFRAAGYDKQLPDGVRWEASSATNTPASQIDVKGYDPDVFVKLDFCDPKQDVKDDRVFRSHLSLVVSRKCNKIITIPCLKDHRATGVTGALKNMSHGFSNNVARSHGGAHLNQTNVFIPAVCSLAPIRQKVVLHILDGLRGVYQGGPFSGNWPADPWVRGSIFLAADPVALDAVAWKMLDEKRVSKGLPVLARSGLMGENPTGKETFFMRLPQHVAVAESIGLGVFDETKVVHRRVPLA